MSSFFLKHGNSKLKMYEVLKTARVETITKIVNHVGYCVNWHRQRKRFLNTDGGTVGVSDRKITPNSRFAPHIRMNHIV